MGEEVKLIDKQTLLDKGIISLIRETPGSLVIEGIPITITAELKELIELLFEVEALNKKKEHARKTEEGMKRAGAKRGRTPIDPEVQDSIIKLRAQGVTQERIFQILKELGVPLSRPTIIKYCKLASKEDSMRGEENVEDKGVETDS